MKRILLSLLMMVGLVASCKTITPTVNLDINVAQKGADMSPTMFGIFFEDINHAGDGGLYAELILNRSFEERVLPKGGYTISESGELVAPPVMNHLAKKPTNGTFRWGKDPHPGWSLDVPADAKATMKIDNKDFNWDSAPSYMEVKVEKAGAGVSLVNSGYWGIALKKGESYKLRVIATTPDLYKGDITAKIVGANGAVLSEKVLKTVNNSKWNDYNEVMVAADTTTVGRLLLVINSPGVVKFDYVSLFPVNTFHGRENGMRSDLSQVLADLKPTFVRWPGGCVAEGITLSNRVEWKKSLGDPAKRSGEYNTWGYRSSYGFGYKEFLDFCEDLGAQGMFVCNVGLGCQARCGDACPDHEVDFYVQDALDAIEYAIGDVNTTWGSVRAKEGHPEPYQLKYVEIGNENSGPVYDKRFDIFADAIRAKYPHLILISNHGDANGAKNVKKTDMIDPHWYVEPDYFFRNSTIFDNIERGNYTIYVGEYACNRNVGTGNMIGALSEAAFLTGMERNSDLVTMASYAPLLENVEDTAWPTNLIRFNNNQVLPRSSYYVQKMFADNAPTYNVETKLDAISEPSSPIAEPGYIAFGTWETQSQFKEIKITTADGRVLTPDVNDKSQWSVVKGNWGVKDGAQTQSGQDRMTAIVWNKEKVGECTIEFKTRKNGGNEGFLVYFGLPGTDLNKGTMLNIGGWGNGSSAFQNIDNANGTTVSDMVGDRVENNKWYDVKTVIKPTNAEYFINGASKLKYEGKPIPKVFTVAGYDVDNNEIIIKFVNAKNEKLTSKINLAGAEVQKVGDVVTLSADSPTDENTFDDLQKITPRSSQFKKFSNSFIYEFEPNSLTILRIKRK